MKALIMKQKLQQLIIYLTYRIKLKECSNINYLPTKEYSFMELENVNFEGLPIEQAYTSNKPPKNLFSTLEAYVGVNEQKIQKVVFIQKVGCIWGKILFIINVYRKLSKSLSIVLVVLKELIIHLNKRKVF